MTYAYQSHIYLAEAVLNVKDLTSQTAFITRLLAWRFYLKQRQKRFWDLVEKPWFT